MKKLLSIAVLLLIAVIAYGQSGHAPTTGISSSQTMRIVGHASVKYYGAKCDNATDDSVAVQAAFDAVSQGGTVNFGSGTCIVSNITVTGGVTIQGHATLKLKAAASLNFNPILRLTGPNVIIQGLTFDGNRANQPADGFSDSWNTGANGTGKSNRAAIYGDNYGTGYSISNVKISDCKFINSWGSSIAMRDVSDVDISHNTFENNNFENAMLYASGTVRNKSAHVVGNKSKNTYSGHATVNANNFVLSYYDGIIFSQNTTTVVERNIAKFEACTEAIVSNNSLDTNLVPGFNCLQTQAGASNFTITGNVLKNCQKGMAFTDSNPITDFVVSNNIISDVVGTPGTPDGMAFDNGTRISITGNKVSRVTRHGVYLKDISSLIFSGNTIIPKDDVTSSIGLLLSYSADGDDILIDNNIIGAGFANDTDGAMIVTAASHTISNIRVENNIIHTKTNSASEKGITMETGTFVAARIHNNFTDGKITSSEAVIRDNQAGALVPGETSVIQTTPYLGGGLYSSGTDTISLGVSVNGGFAGAGALVLCVGNSGTGDNTGFELFLVRLGYDGDNVTATSISRSVGGGFTNSWTFGSTDGLLTVTADTGGNYGYYVFYLY